MNASNIQKTTTLLLSNNQSIEFDIDDIVRSGLVRNYLLTKIALGM